MRNGTYYFVDNGLVVFVETISSSEYKSSVTLNSGDNDSLEPFRSNQFTISADNTRG